MASTTMSMGQGKRDEPQPDYGGSSKKPPLNPKELRKLEYKEAMHEPSQWTPVKRKNKVPVRDTFDSMYNGVKVCRQCYEIYLLLKDYFDELLANHHKASDAALSQSASKAHLLTPSEIIKDARSFSHSNISLNYLEGRKLVGGEKRDKSQIVKNLDKIIKEGEGDQGSNEDKPVQKRHVTEGFRHIASKDDQDSNPSDSDGDTVVKKMT